MQSRLLRNDFVDDLRSLAAQHGRFSAALGLPRDGMTLSPSEIKIICERIITPLCVSSKEMLIFEQEDTLVFRDFSANVEKCGTRYRVKKGQEVVRGFESYWGAYQNQRGTIVFVATMGDQKFEEFMRLSQDPGITLNLRTIASSSAIRSSHSIVNADESKLAFLLSANQGLNKIHIFAHASRMRRCVDIALDQCEYTNRYLGLYGAANSS